MSQLSILIPEQTYQVGDQDVTIKPFKFKQFNDVLDIINKYFDKLKTLESNDNIIAVIFEKSKNKYQVLADLSKLITMTTNLEETDLDEFTYDQVISIFSVIVKQNKDFFSQIGDQINPPEPVQNGKIKTGELKSVA